MKHKGLALDLGFGEGRDSIFLSQKGFKVRAIENDQNKIKQFEEKARQLNIDLTLSDISKVSLEKNTYSLIMAQNVLPFLPNKKEVLETIKKCVDSLSPEGYFVFSIFGKKDEWNRKKKHMAFLDYEEILRELDKNPVAIYFKSSEEGYGPTIKGDIKYWQIHKFIIEKDK